MSIRTRSATERATASASASPVPTVASTSWPAPVCEEAYPLTDVAHVGSLGLGVLLPMVVVWTLWRARLRPGWFMRMIAVALAAATVVSLANSPIV